MSTNFFRHPFLIEPQELMQRLNSSSPPMLIDTRKPPAYDEGHLANAYPLSSYDYFVAQSTEEGMQNFIAEIVALYESIGIQLDHPIVVYDEHTGMRAARELWLLKYLGHSQVFMLHGGVPAWIDAGGLLDKQIPSIKRSTITPTLQTDQWVYADNLYQQLANQNLILLDVRTKEEFKGEDNTDCCPNHGRIPGAVHIEWTEFLEQGKFKSPKKIQTLLASQGIQPCNEIIVYCHRGARAANAYYALLSAGYTHVYNYMGSCHEWSNNRKYPLARG